MLNSTFYTRFGRQVGHSDQRIDERGPAVRAALVDNRIDTDKNVVCTNYLGNTQGE